MEISSLANWHVYIEEGTEMLMNLHCPWCIDKYICKHIMVRAEGRWVGGPGGAIAIELDRKAAPASPGM